MKTLNTKNSTMKNILNNVIVAFVALALTFATVSCKKNKDEDPTPSNPNNNGNNTAPTVSASYAPSSATAPATVTITAIASDADGSITKVQFVKNGNVDFEDVSSPYEYVLTSLAAGTYTYTVKAIDNKGASTTTTVTFTVNTSGGSNNAPTFTGTALTVASDGSAKVVDIASLIHDADGNTLSIVSVSPMTGVSNVNGTTFTVTPTNSVFAGALSYTVVITDGTDNTSSTVTVTVGTSTQVDTYTTINSYFGNLPNSDIGNCTLNAGSITTTTSQASGEFFTTATSAGTYPYVINTNGSITFTANGTQTTYSVQSSGGVLTLTNVNSGSNVYNLY